MAVLSASSYAVTASAGWLRGRRDDRGMRELLERGTRLSLLVAWPVGILAGGLAYPIVRVWVGDRYDAAAGLAIVALVPLVSAPLQVGSNMLRGSGRVRAILLPAAASTAVNLAASVVLVRINGIVGVFQATIISTIVLLPLLGRAVLTHVGLSASSFLRTSVTPVLLPSAALAGVVALVLLLPIDDIATVVVATIVGGAVYLAVAWRAALQPDERADLRRLLPHRAR